MRQVAAAGEHGSLGALLLRLTSPGLPDIYQGDAFWSLNLVDPDNRRGVDWRRHRQALGEETPRRETLKLHLIRRVLRVRVVVPLRPGTTAGGGEDDLLSEFPQELSLLR